MNATSSAPDRVIVRLLRGEGPLPAAGDPSWDVVARRLVANGLPGIALSELGKRGRLDHLTAAARGLLEGELDKVRVSQVVLFDRFEKLADLLGSAGVEFIVHKGGALAPLVYDRAVDRPMVDVDIVIHARQWGRVRDLLRQRGYRLPAGAEEAFWLENYFNLGISSPGNPPASFDLHWSLTQEGRYHIDTEELFSRAVPYTWDGRRYLRLNNEDLLLSLFLHLAYHYFEARLLWLYDMKRVLERYRIDWDVVIARASRWGLMTVVAFNVTFLEKVFPGIVPAGVIERTRPGGVRRALVRPLVSGAPCVLFRGSRRRSVHFILGLLSIDRPGDAVRFALNKVFRSLRWVGRGPRRR